MLTIIRTMVGLVRRRDGVAAVEFAMVAPIVIVLLLVGVDTGRFIIATERIGQVASAIGEMISENQVGYVTDTDLQFFHDSAMVIFPQLLADAQRLGIPWSNDIAITMTSLKFTAAGGNCGTLCVYIPQVLWTGGASPRSCTLSLTAAVDSATPNPATLPADVFQAGSLIVVDVVYNFVPTVALPFISSITVRRSYYLPPRFVPQISYHPSVTPFATNCPLV